MVYDCVLTTVAFNLVCSASIIVGVAVVEELCDYLLFCNR